MVNRTCTGAAALLLVMTACGNPYKDGVKAYNEGRYEEAIEHLRKVRRLSREREDAEAKIAGAYFQMGKRAYEEKKWPQAIELLSEISRNDADYQEARGLMGGSRYFLGKAALERGETEEATALLYLVRKDCEYHAAAQELLQELTGESEAEE